MTHRIVITTCPRPEDVGYLGQTMASIGHPVTVLSDEQKRGARWNTWRALSWGDPVDRLLLFQDDVIVEDGLVDRMLAFDIPKDVGLVSFHDCGDDFDWLPPPTGIHKFRAHRLGSQGLCGAQCLLIPGEHARWIASQDMNACPKPGPHGADYAIGWWTARSARPWKLIVAPSPVLHIGELSACHQDVRSAAGAGIPHAGDTIEAYR
jgi:hypothetical protein